MSLALAVAVATAPATLPACTWDRPGHNPFTGDLVAAVDRYADIPAAVRARLKARMAQRQYDEIVDIRRDRIDGRKASYRAEIRDMHFGTGQVCGTVTRARWSEQALERGLVYCEDGHCLLVPTVCRNLSRIQRSGGMAAASGAGPAAAAATGAGASAGAGAGAPGGSTGEGASAAGAAPTGRGTDMASSGAHAGAGDTPDGQHDMAAAPGSFARGAAPLTAAELAQAAPDAAQSGGLGGGRGDAAAVRWTMPGGTGSAGVWVGDGSGAASGGGTVMPSLAGTSQSMSGIAFVSRQNLADGPAATLPGTVPAAPVPEPGTVALWALGLAALWRMARRRAPEQDAISRA